VKKIMADILPFKRPSAKKKNTVKKSSGHTLCKAGFHKWKVDNSAAFAVREGKLLTRYICERCGKTRTDTT
jgi:hypothetical protein